MTAEVKVSKLPLWKQIQRAAKAVRGRLFRADGKKYYRAADGSIRRVKPKVRGKSARRVEKKARRLARVSR